MFPPLKKKVTWANFSRLGDPRLAETGAADDFAQGVVNLSWRKSYRQVFELVVIEGQDDKIKLVKISSWEALEIWVGEGLCELNLTLTAPAAKNDCIAVFNPANRFSLGRGNDNGFKRVIRTPFAVHRPDGFSDCGSSPRPVSVDD